MINARHVNVSRYHTGGVYTTLMDYLERRKVVRMPFVEAQQIAVAGVNVIKVDSDTHLVGGNIAVMKADPPVSPWCITDGAICMAEVAGVVGTGATTSHVDNLGNILNLIDQKFGYSCRGEDSC